MEDLLEKHGKYYLCYYAAKTGQLDVLQWARQNNCYWTVWTCTDAAENGHLHILQWLHEHNCPWDEMTCAFAAYKGHLHILQWARKKWLSMGLYDLCFGSRKQSSSCTSMGS